MVKKKVEIKMEENEKYFLHESKVICYSYSNITNKFELLVRTIEEKEILIEANQVEIMRGEFWNDMMISDFFEYDLSKSNDQVLYFMSAVNHIFGRNFINPNYADYRLIYIHDIRGTEISIVCKSLTFSYSSSIAPEKY